MGIGLLTIGVIVTIGISGIGRKCVSHNPPTFPHPGTFPRDGLGRSTTILPNGHRGTCDQTLQAMIETAVRLLGERSFDGLSVRDWIDRS
jgi:hypothetical protein